MSQSSPRLPLFRVGVAFPAAQVVGSAFNIWYNLTHVAPLLSPRQSAALHGSITTYNLVVYPAALLVWCVVLRSIAPAVAAWRASREPPPNIASMARVRLINLPWIALAIAAPAWLGCIPAFLTALARIDDVPSAAVLHLTISLVIGALIALTLGMFLVEYLSQKLLYDMAFRDASAWDLPGAIRLGLLGRGLWGTAATAVAPVVCMLLLAISPRGGVAFPVAVAAFAVAFALTTAWLFGRYVLEPIQALQAAARRIAEGDYSARVELPRSDELGRLLDSFNSMATGLEEKERLRGLFGRHVGRRAAERILRQVGDLGGEEQDVTVLFADLRGFTTAASIMGPSEAVAQLNEFFAAMTVVVEDRRQGVIDKFLGDGLLAVFGLTQHEAYTADAVAAAIEMFAALDDLNARRAAAGLPAWRMGVGIHCGPALVGSVGSPQRMEFTVMGDVVNAASRVQDLTKELKAPLLVTAEVLQRLTDPPPTIAQGEHQLRGRSQTTELYAVQLENASGER